MTTDLTSVRGNPPCTLCNPAAPTDPPATPVRTVHAAPRTPCPRCGVRHGRWHKVARCLWPKAIWITGDPPRVGPCYAVVSHCHPGCTVTLHPDLDAARQSKHLIDNSACGSGCRRAAGHEIVHMA